MNFPRKIYAIRHNVTNRVYVGSSHNVDQRLKSHIGALRRHSHTVEDMQADFDKYGEDFTFTILDEVFKYEDRAKEYEWMKVYQSHIRGIGYNYKDFVFSEKPARSPSIMLTFNGVTMSIREWSTITNIPYSVIYNRVAELGWDIEKALTTPKGRRGRYVHTSRA